MEVTIPPNFETQNASDIIKTLQLENMSLKEKYIKETDILSETITNKNTQLDKQRIKLMQYEFALQEALIFLGKPLNTYEEWLQSNVTTELDIQFQKTIPTHMANVSPRVSAIGGRGSLKVSDITSHQKSLSTPTSTKSNPHQDMTTLEVNCMESMHLCFNFLNNCQRLVQKIDQGTYTIPEVEAKDPNANESLTWTTKPVEKSSLGDLTPTVILSPDKEKTKSVSTLPQKTKTPTRNIIIDDKADGDLSSSPMEENSGFTSTIGLKKNNCDKCRENLLKLDTERDQLKKVETNNKELELKLAKEIKSRKIIQQAKDLIDREIEDITAELFARANQIVVDNQRARDDLYTVNKELTKNNRDLTARLKSREKELFDATKYLYELQAIQMNSNQFSNVTNVHRKSLVPDLKKNSLVDKSLPVLPQAISPTTSTTPTTEPKVKHISEFVHTIFSGYDKFESLVAVDGIIFQEFQELMKVIVLSANQPSVLAFQSIHSTSFIKRCMIENVEPCLYYTYTPRSGFKNLGPGLTQSFKKKILDLCIKGHVLIQPQAIEIAPCDSKDSSKSPPKMFCSFCTVTRECEYQYRFGLPESTKPEMGSICRFCRDRVSTVTDFFTFLSLLTVSHSGTILSSFKQILWLKRRMSMAVNGSCSLFETEITAILGPGGSGDWEKSCDIIY